MIDNIPHLQTALNGPLLDLERKILTSQIQIEAWFRKTWMTHMPPIMVSTDLRNAGFKVAPVDTNLFPAGFNHLEQDLQPLAIQAVQTTLNHAYPDCQNILLVPESHTRNINYFENVATLYEILTKAGYRILIGSMRTELNVPNQISLPSGRKITLHPIRRERNRLTVSGESPCVILLNNDLSSGVPELFEGIEQPIEAPLKLSWATRLKSTHFSFYDSVAREFSKVAGIDPWLINPLFTTCREVDFMRREGEDILEEAVNFVLDKTRQKYKEYGITESPFVFVKADAGTYGMGVMMLKSASEIKSLNRKQRSKMATSKGSKKITQVIIQEGVPTFETIRSAFAEPVVYAIGQHVIGGFYRVHEGRSAQDNLNAPGMAFEPLAFAKPCNSPDMQCKDGSGVNRFYLYGVIARLTAIAAAKEREV